jgi:hypothetical protein
VLVCRGCCCARDDLEASAARQLDAVRAAVSVVAGARIRRTDCLGPCSSKNVIAIRHRHLDTPGRRHGTTWLGGLDDGVPLTDLESWLRVGAVGAVPASIAPYLLVDPMVVPDEMLRPTPRR